MEMTAAVELRELGVLIASLASGTLGFDRKKEFREAKCAPEGFAHPSHWP